MKYDKYLMAQMNKMSVIDLIRTRGPISKTEIAKLTELSLPTIMKITEEFEKNNLIHVIGKGESSGGKRPELLDLIPDAYFIIGVDIGRNTTKVIIMNLSGNIVSKETMMTGKTLPEENLISRVIDLIDLAIKKSDISKEKFLGMGIGMPGLLNSESGMVLFSPDFEWENVNLVEPIKAYFGVNICLENSTRALAMGESWFGVGIDSTNFVCVSIGHGIGSAIMQDGEFYRGSCGSSGEIGHFTLDKNGPKCGCGNSGCLEALSSGNAIARDARALVSDGVGSLIMELADRDIDKIDARIVFEAAKHGDAAAKQIVDRAIEFIGIGLAGYINIIDPDMIILAGGVVSSGDYFLNELEKVIKVRQMKFAGRKVKIRVAKLGLDAAAVGAASIILKSFIENGGMIEI